MARARHLHAAVQLQEAANACARVLAADAGHAEANHLLGLILHQAGQADEAVAAMDKAVAREPGNAIYHANRGVVLKAADRLDAAVASYEAALRIDPELSAVRSNLGVALLGLKRVDEAIAAHRQAIAGNPRHAEAHANLGLALVEAGRPDDALACYAEALALKPDYGNAMLYQALALKALGRLDEAKISAEAAVARQPLDPAAHHALGSILMVQGDWTGAVESYAKAVEIKPEVAAYRNLGNVLNDLGRYKKGVAAIRAALAIDPDDAVALGALAHAQHKLGNPASAVTTFGRILANSPDDSEARHGLGVALLAAGQVAEARREFEHALALDPDNLGARAGLLFLSNYLADLPVAEMVAAAISFGKLLAAGVTARTSHPNAPDPERRLKVGLVSGDLRTHPVARFLEDVLPALDRERIELFAYATMAEEDAMTERLRRSVPHWREAAWMSEDQLAELILADGIDVLVDLAGLTGNARPGVFARKPAPVAVTWLGYFATTGISAIDYVLANQWVIPQSEEDQWVEKPWRLPETYLCFSPPKAEVPLRAPPALAAGSITFGSSNNLNKLNDATIAVWSDVLRAVPQSRLLLRSAPLGQAKISNATKARFSAQGIGEERLILEGAVADYAGHLDQYNRVDIALDPFPYAGGTTSVEALWMGVPVLTLKGDRYVAHMGENILHNLGLPEWIAADRADYVCKAAAFAADLDGLAALKRSLRARLVASPLCDAPRFARHLEAAFRGMWATWCAQHGRPLP